MNYYESRKAQYDDCPDWLRITATFHPAQKSLHNPVVPRPLYKAKIKKPCLVTNAITNQSAFFSSITEAAKFIKVAVTSLTAAIKEDRPIKGFYVKRCDSNMDERG